MDRKWLLVTLLFFLSVFTRQPVFAQDSLTVLVMPSTRVLNWSSPRSLLMSYLDGELDKLLVTNLIPDTHKFTIGHVVVRVKCATSDGQEQDFWTGITGQNNRDVDLDNIFNKKIGLGVILANYDDGYIQTTPEVLGLIRDYQGRRHFEGSANYRRVKPYFFRYPIGPSACDEIVAYYKSFKRLAFGSALPPEELAKKLPKDKLYYGFQMYPYEQYLDLKSGIPIPDDYRYGGGCTAFSVGFLRLAGHYDDFIHKSWMRRIEYTHHLVGGPDPDTGIHREVPIFRFLGHPGGYWVKSNMSRQVLDIYDPEHMWRTMRQVYKCIKKGSRNCDGDTWEYLQSQRDARLEELTIPTPAGKVLRIPGVSFGGVL